MNIKESPCYKCQSRTIDCHDNCNQYKNWHKDYKDFKEYLKPRMTYLRDCFYVKKGCKFYKKIRIVGENQWPDKK